MSIFTDVAIPTTLTDLLKSRDDALRLIKDARRITDKVEEMLSLHGRYLMPKGGQFTQELGAVRQDLDVRMWQRAFDLTGFKQLMDATAVAEFERSMHPKTPEFNEANIRSTFIQLLMEKDKMFRRGIFNVFRYLSDEYRTNQKEPFRMGRKVVMSWMISRSFRKGLCISYGNSSDKLNDIDRVFITLDKKPFTPRSLEWAMNVAFEEGQVFESDYYRAKAYKNGNLHLEFKRLDLLEKLNDEIAEFYSDGALPDARCA